MCASFIPPATELGHSCESCDFKLNIAEDIFGHQAISVVCSLQGLANGNISLL